MNLKINYKYQDTMIEEYDVWREEQLLINIEEKICQKKQQKLSQAKT